MNKTERHQAAAARLDEIKNKTHELFSACDEETKGMTTDKANEVWRDKYQDECKKLFRILEAVGNMYFYTDNTVATRTKQVNHRHAVAKMRAAGLHRMNTVSK